MLNVGFLSTCYRKANMRFSQQKRARRNPVSVHVRMMRNLDAARKSQPFVVASGWLCVEQRPDQGQIYISIWKFLSDGTKTGVFVIYQLKFTVSHNSWRSIRAQDKQ